MNGLAISVKDNEYIQPLTKVYSSFSEAKEDAGKQEYSFYFEDKEPLKTSELAQGNRNLVVGEPGIGKTELMKRFELHHHSLGHEVCFVSLKSLNPTKEIDIFIGQTTSTQKVLILDALDETRSAIFPEVLEKLEDVSTCHPEIIIYLSSRWVFVNNYASQFPGYRFIKVFPFSNKQVKDYLVRVGNSEAQVDALLTRIMQFGHGKLVVQIPRYLSLLEKFIKQGGIDSIAGVSRNQLFEFFIYSKLELEGKNLNSGDGEVIKRVLEKLALTMEIYQTNEISIDELMTFFDDIDSGLKHTVLSKVTLDVFLAKTVLQRSAKDLTKLEFENAEFQEYLAAKEITRFAEPQRTVFGFAVDQNLNEILPSWFNTLTFLVDMDVGVLYQLIEFSGLRNGGLRVVDDGFLDFLSRINPAGIPVDLKREIFRSVVDYHGNKKQWLTGQLASALPEFFASDLERELKERTEEAESEIGSNRYVPLGNIAYLVAQLFRAGISLDRSYWREKLLLFAKDENDSGVLQRHALYGLATLGDASVIDELPNLFSGGDELVGREFLETCIALDADHPKTLSYSIEAVKRNDFHGRYGLFGLKKKDSIITFLKTFIEDEKFRSEFLDDTSTFNDQDSVLIDNIESIFDTEINDLSKEVIVQSLRTYLHHHINNSDFINGLIRLLKRKEAGFIGDLVGKLNDPEQNSHALFFSQDTFAQVLDKNDTSEFLDAMINAGETRGALDTMIKIKYSDRNENEAIFEAGRPRLSKEYSDWEAAQTKGRKSLVVNEQLKKEKTLKEFEFHLQPAPNQYNEGVFAYYNHHANELDPLSEKDRTRLVKLITESVLKFNPSAHGLTATNHNEDGSIRSYTSSSSAHIFGPALEAARHLGIDIASYRANIACYIPFAYDDDLRKLFEIVNDFTKEELAPLVAIYTQRNSDLWRHRPESFIEVAQRCHITDAATVVRDFVKERSFRAYTRNKALQTAESLAPDPAFLKEVFNIYAESEDAEERDVAYTANGLLITVYADNNALAWRMLEIKKRVASFIPLATNGKFAHKVGSLENELMFDKPFAKPLSDLKRPGFENEYLDLLSAAIDTWNRGEHFHSYAQYMWEIVFSHFENLKEYGIYDPLKKLQQKVDDLKDQEGANWLARRAGQLRRSYLLQLGRPRNFSEAVLKYNEARKFNGKNIFTSSDLNRHAQEAIETDLRRWVEGEGAYNIIVSEKKFKGNAEYEKLIQKTIKTQLENIFLKRGISVDIAREEQLIDDKRTDLIIRYGFIGPIVLEVKLSSNGDIRTSQVENTESYKSMCRYMEGYGASYGIFLIVDNTGTPHLARARDVFGKIPKVWATSLDCYKFSPPKKTKKTKVKKGKKEVSRKSRKLKTKTKRLVG